MIICPIVNRALLGLALATGGCETVDSLIPSFGSSPESAPPAKTVAAPPPAPQIPTGPAPAPVTARPDSPPTSTVATGPYLPGFDSNNAFWCLSVSPNGDVAIGNPGDRAGMLRPVGKNVLAGLSNRQPRSFAVKCVPPNLLPQDSHICRAMDSWGNVYGGNVRNPASPTFFRRLVEATSPVATGAMALMPGFDCNDATLCLGVTPAGDVYIGNPNGYEGGMRPTGKNVLAGQANRQPRSFTVRCVETGTLQDAFVCRASDGFGHLYAGNSRSADNPNFFKAL